MSDFFEDQDLNDPDALPDCAANFISSLRRGEFLAWEAVVAREQRVPLTEAQHDALDALIDLNICPGDPVYYINGLPRTTEPWHRILDKIARRLIVSPSPARALGQRKRWRLWEEIAACLCECTGNLSLPSSRTTA